MKQNMQDLTEGPLGKKILIFSVPLMLSNLLQVLFNMADIAVIGQFAGSLSLGAVGSTATLVTMFTGFLIGLSGGINVLTTAYGAKDKDSLSKTIHSAALVSLIMGVLLLVLGVGLSVDADNAEDQRGTFGQSSIVPADLLSGNAGAGHLQLW